MENTRGVPIVRGVITGEFSLNKRPRGLNADGFLRRWAYQLWTRENEVIMVSCHGLSEQPRAIEFLWQEVWAFFLCEDFLGEISKPPTNKDLAFVTAPFSFMLR